MISLIPNRSLYKKAVDLWSATDHWGKISQYNLSTEVTSAVFWRPWSGRVRTNINQFSHYTDDTAFDKDQ